MALCGSPPATMSSKGVPKCGGAFLMMRVVTRTHYTAIIRIYRTMYTSYKLQELRVV